MTVVTVVTVFKLWNGERGGAAGRPVVAMATLILSMLYPRSSPSLLQGPGARGTGGLHVQKQGTADQLPCMPLLGCRPDWLA